jgi:hypothetical protein
MHHDRGSVQIWSAAKDELICSLCEKTPTTWTPPRWKCSYKWTERIYRTRSIVMCPSCRAGQWLNYSPTEWKVTTPRHTTIFSQETINWTDKKSELVSRKTEQFALYTPDGDRLSKERINAELQRKGHDSKEEEDKENENPTTLTEGKKRSIVGSSNLIQTTKVIVKKHQTEVMKMKKRIQNKSIGKPEKQ